MLKKKRPILRIAAVLVVLVVGAVIAIRPWREKATLVAAVVYSEITKPYDPLTRAIRKGSRSMEQGNAVPLVPNPLSARASRADVEKLLQAGKYSPDPDKRFAALTGIEFPQEKLFYEGSVFYERRTQEFPCAFRYSVVVRYDAQGRLIEAVGGRGGSCL